MKVELLEKSNEESKRVVNNWDVKLQIIILFLGMYSILLKEWLEDGQIVADYYSKKLDETGFTWKSIGERETEKERRFFVELFRDIPLTDSV